MLAIESAMHVLSSENRGTERSIKLQRKVSKWLSEAERLKVCIIFASGFFDLVIHDIDLMVNNIISFFF